MSINIVNLIDSTIILSIPLILAAIGGTFSVRAGIMALGLEGQILMGAFAAAAGSHFTGNPWIGLLCGVLGGMSIGLSHGILSVKYKVNQVIGGIGLNLLVISGTTVLLESIWGSRGNSSALTQLPNIETDIFKNIPVLDQWFGVQSIFFYLMIGLTILSWFLIFKTVFGLRLRMVGENPKAAATLGLKVNKYKYSAVALCGALCGLAGSYLSISYLNMFSREMSAGRGYIAVVINILGGYNPIGAALSGFVFSIANALQITLQGTGISTDLIAMIPYLVTIIVLIIGGKRIRAPFGIGKNADD